MTIVSADLTYVSKGYINDRLKIAVREPFVPDVHPRELPITGVSCIIIDTHRKFAQPAVCSHYPLTVNICSSVRCFVIITEQVVSKPVAPNNPQVR